MSHQKSEPNLASLSKAERRSWLLIKAMDEGASLSEAFKLARQADEWMVGKMTPGHQYGGGVNIIISAVCEATGLCRHTLLGQSRQADVAEPRQLVMLLARELTGASTTQIGRQLGDRDHTTVLHGVRVAAKRIQRDADYQALKAEVIHIIGRIQENPLKTGDNVIGFQDMRLKR